MRLGIDVGGTKIELVALQADGTELLRRRRATPRTGYADIIAAITALVRDAETQLNQCGTVGVGIPGTISAHTGLIKNANTTELNGRPLQHDLAQSLGRDVRVMNDANCLAISEATDGAGAGQSVVFAAILGTGCGAGLAINGQPWAGRNRVAGEWGHNPLPWMTADEAPGPPCWCGQSGCIETWVSGTGFAADHARAHPDAPPQTAEQIVAAARQGKATAQQALTRYSNRLARALAHVINLLDPDVIVLGGGMSNVDELYQLLPAQLPRHVFGAECTTPVVRNRHGDSSGVRGAAWLWPA